MSDKKNTKERTRPMRIERIIDELETALTGARNDTTVAEKSDAKRIAQRIHDLNIDATKDLEDIFDDYGSILDGVPMDIDDSRFIPNSDDYRDSYPEETITALQDIVSKCQRTEDAVQTFIRETSHLTDLPAAADYVGEVSMEAHAFKIQTQFALRQMEITNEKAK